MAKTPKERPADHKTDIAVELYEALRKLGAKSDLLSIVGSYGDTQEDRIILGRLRLWNAHHVPEAPADEGTSPEDLNASNDG